MTIVRAVEVLTPKDTGETDTLWFDYSAELADGETLVSAVITVSVLSGTDASPSSLLFGSPTVSGGYILQSITGGVRNVNYLIRCLASTSAGRILAAVASMEVVTLGQI